MKYIRFLRKKIYLGVLIVLGCAMLGSVWGARTESKEELPGVTQEDIRLSQQADYHGPELIGIFPLAAEQNKWYNFKYAAVFGLAGVVVYCVLMAGYLHWYYLPLFKFLRKCLGMGRKEYNLFLDLGEDV